MSAYPNLFAPIKAGPFTLPNRIIMGSMHTGLEVEPHGVRRIAAFYAARARGGTALIITGGYGPNRAGRMTPHPAFIASREDAMALKPVADAVHAESGRILRDNVYGSVDEDIWRRDFTVNALYYNIADFTLWDYTSGLEDIRTRTLRLIGDPRTRYHEDPVRMLRAIRFAAKLDFHIAPETGEPIAELAHLLRDVPPARLYDELLKLFQSGHAVRSFELLLEYDLFRYLFLLRPLPSTDNESAIGGAGLQLRNIDEYFTLRLPTSFPK